MRFKDTRVLYIVAHADDEWVMLQHLKTARRVKIVIVTEDRKIQAVRKSESLAHGTSAGFRAEDYVFLSDQISIPDLQAINAIELIRDAVLKAIDAQSFDQIITHDFEAGHPDHDAVHLTCRLIAKQLNIPVMSYCSYRSGPFGLPILFRRLEKKTNTIKLRYSIRQLWHMLKGAMKFKSQWKAMGILSTYGLTTILM